MIVIVDSGGANLASVKNALARMDQTACVSSDRSEIERASHVILPGVGSAGACMSRLTSNGLLPCIRGLKQPILGVCLGMQLLFEYSDEGAADCLGILPGRVSKIPQRESLAVPHMGWNQVFAHGNSPRLLKGIPRGSFFYFVHSFIAPHGIWVEGTCDYGGEIPAVVSRDNFFGVQFHPEKSAEAGRQILKNFLAL